MDRIYLNGKWELIGEAPDGTGLELCGSVPGSALSDIVEAGIEKEHKDIFYRDNAEYFQKYENYNWHYRKAFTLDKTDARAVFVCERLDTYCDIYLNDVHIGGCDNGNIEHRFDVTDAIKCGENEINIYFYSPVQTDKGKKKRKFAAFSTDRLYTRRTQCTYGWDWTMRFVTCGMGDVYIELPQAGLKIAGAYVYTSSIDENSAAIGVDVELEDYSDGGVIDIEIIDDDGKTVARKSRYCREKYHKFNIDIANPKLWYPLGYGEQNIHTLVISSSGRELFRERFGIRVVKILELRDEEGSENYKKCLRQRNDVLFENSNVSDDFSCFTVYVNGKKIMCKGGNWVPCEPFNMGNTDEKVTYLLELFAKAGVNMIRIWGGGAFETEHFYDECSRLGIMVSQDFLMACGDYPEEDERFIAQLQREAEYVTKLARNKPCLIWWTGDNENGTWGNDKLDVYHGRISARQGAAPVIYKNDPYRRFFPSSPYGGGRYASNTAGIAHNTYFLNTMYNYIERDDLSDYRDYFKHYIARFCAEEPTMGAAQLSSLRRFMSDEDIFGADDTMWRYHTKTNPSLKKHLFEYNDEFARKLFGSFENAEDRMFKYKYIQYEWLRLSMEQARREKDFCSGILYWMLNDCWPASLGWSFVDYYGIPKASYYSFRRASKQIILSIDFEDNKYKIYLCNDGDAAMVRLSWNVISADGVVLYTSDYTEVEAEGYKSVVVLEVNEADVPDGCFITAELENGDRAFYKKGCPVLTGMNDGLEYSITDDGVVELTAKKYIHAVELEGDTPFEDNYFSLMPGETRRISYKINCDITVCGYTFK